MNKSLSICIWADFIFVGLWLVFNFLQMIMYIQIEFSLKSYVNFISCKICKRITNPSYILINGSF